MMVAPSAEVKERLKNWDVAETDKLIEAFKNAQSQQWVPPPPDPPPAHPIHGRHLIHGCRAIHRSCRAIHTLMHTLQCMCDPQPDPRVIHTSPQ